MSYQRSYLRQPTIKEIVADAVRENPRLAVLAAVVIGLIAGSCVNLIVIAERCVALGLS